MFRADRTGLRQQSGGYAHVWAARRQRLDHQRHQDVDYERRNCGRCNHLAQTDDGIRGFAVPTNSKGFTANSIERKLSLRASITSELVLDNCRVPGEAAFPDVRGLRGPLACLSEARFGIIWGAMGAARACFETALDYAKTRLQFGRAIGGFQITQQKLVNMLLELNKGTLLALHKIGRAHV